MTNQQCREKIADCCKIIRLELSRWAGKQLSNNDLKLHYDSTNWTKISQHTIKGVTTRKYRFNKSGLRVEGTVTSYHDGYYVSAHLWAPKTNIDSPEASCWGQFEK